MIVGPKGSHIKNIENVTKASVDAERDGTTVIVRGAVPDVIRAREMIEDALTRNGIDFRGKPGRGFPREDRENPEGRAAGGAETRGGGPGGDLRGLLKRKSLDADAAAAPPKAKKGPAAAANRADDPTEWMQAELEKMKARATRFGLPPPTMDDVRAKNPHKVSDKKVSDTGTVDKGFVDDDETVVVPVADKHTMSRVIGKKRSVLSMMCKVADCSMIVGNKEMAVRVRCPDAVRRAHAVALLDAVIGDEIAGARITFHGLQAAFAAIQSGAPTPKADQADEAAAADAKNGKGKGGVMSRLQGDDQDDDEDEDQDEDADDADDERPKKRQAASFKFHRTVDPRGFLGAVIGKNGGTIKKLEKVTKTKMDVDQEAKTVEVKSDSARATARGCELIESIIVSCERTKSERAAGKKTEKFVLGDILQSAIARWKNGDGDGDGDEKSAPGDGDGVPSQATPGMFSYVRQWFVDELGADGAAAVAAAAAAAPTDDSLIMMQHAGGAVRRGGPGGDDETMAFPHREWEWSVVIIALWTDPGADSRSAAESWADDAFDSLRGVGVGCYAVDIDRFRRPGKAAETETALAFGEENAARLRELKRRVDPGNLFAAAAPL